MTSGELTDMTQHVVVVTSSCLGKVCYLNMLYMNATYVVMLSRSLLKRGYAKASKVC